MGKPIVQIFRHSQSLNCLKNSVLGTFLLSDRRLWETFTPVLLRGKLAPKKEASLYLKYKATGWFVRRLRIFLLFKKEVLWTSQGPCLIHHCIASANQVLGTWSVFSNYGWLNWFWSLESNASGGKEPDTKSDILSILHSCGGKTKGGLRCRLVTGVLEWQAKGCPRFE